MTLKLFQLITLLLLSINAHSQSAGIQGEIYSKDSEKPLRKAVITITSQDSSIVMRTTTSRSGSFAFEEVNEASYTMKVQRAGYYPAVSFGVVCKENTIVVVEIFLQEVPANMKRKKKKRMWRKDGN